MTRKWRFHNGFTAHLLLPCFSLASTRAILISIHQARDEVRCYRYDECICNNRQNSDAFKNSIPDSYSNRNEVLASHSASETIRMKAPRVTQSFPWVLSAVQTLVVAAKSKLRICASKLLGNDVSSVDVLRAHDLLVRIRYVREIWSMIKHQNTI
jgi:hypothetical protein